MIWKNNLYPKPCKSAIAFFCFCFFGLNNFSSYSQSNTLKVNLDRVKKSDIKVSYFPAPENAQQAIAFKNINGLNYFPVDCQSFISKPQAFDSQNQKISVNQNSEGFKPDEDVSYWEYKIKTSKYPKSLSFGLRSSIYKRRNAYLYPFLFYPVQQSSTEEKTVIIRNKIGQDSALIETFRFTLSDELESFFYARNKSEMKFEIKNKSFGIQIFRPTSDLKSDNIKSILKSIIEAFEKSTSFELPDNFQFVFQEVSNNTSQPLSSVFSNGMNIGYRSDLNTYELNEHIIREVSWQLFRYLTPISHRDQNWTSKSEIAPIHLWYYESLTEYLALICLIENDLITESYFTKIIQEKVSKSFTQPNYSLVQLGKEIVEESKPSQVRKNIKAYDVLKNRGVLTAMVLDIMILNETAGNRNIMAHYLGLIKDGRLDTLNNENFISQVIDIHEPGTKKIVEDYLLGIEEIAFTKYFFFIDWQFFRKGEVHKTFIKRGYLTYFPEIGKYICTKEGKNPIGLKKGDVIISINNDEQVSTMDLKEIILPGNNYRNENRVKVEVIRNGKELVLRGKAEYDTKVKDDIIIPLFNPDSDGYQLRKALMH